MIWMYSGLYKLKLSKNNIEKILNLMSKERSFDFEKNLPEDIYVVSCNCSDTSIDDAPCDGFIDKEYGDIIFADPDSTHGSFHQIIAHELIHILQNYRYFKFKDEYEDPYRERWFEQMAFNLQSQVEKLITKKNLIKITDNELDIEDFLGNNIDYEIPEDILIN